MCSNVAEIEDKMGPKETKKKDQENEYFNCKKCFKKFISQIVFGIHLKIKHGSDSVPLVIKQIPTLAQDTKTLQIQIINKELRLQQSQNGNNKITPHQCPKCNMVFGRQYILQRHIEGIHDKILPHKCNKCQKAYLKKSGLNIHNNIVHEKILPYQCQECKKSFGYIITLQRHIDTVHKKLTPYQCKVCLKSFGLKQNLKIHITFIHK